VRAAPQNLDGLRVRIPCQGHPLVHLIMHSQMQHPYNERIWPPYRAIFDLVLLDRRFGPELHWDAVVRRFSASGQYGLLALHLLRVKASTGMEPPFEVRAGLLTRLRWQRRQTLRRWPTLRYLDPLFMFFIVLGHRLALLHKMLRARDGVQHLFSQSFALCNYSASGRTSPRAEAGSYGWHPLSFRRDHRAENPALSTPASLPWGTEISFRHSISPGPVGRQVREGRSGKAGQAYFTSISRISR
jgi:hypothetical protein